MQNSEGDRSKGDAAVDSAVITSVPDAINRFLTLRNQLCQPQEEFAEVWCRGQRDPDWALIPGIFRTEAKPNCGPANGDGPFDEASMFHDFRVLAPSNHQDHRTLFDWLCLMQHYNVPTRLLDWTENLLFALYFAVEASGSGQGRVFLLAPRRLNQITTAATRGSGRIFVPDSFHVATRAALCRARDYPGWVRELPALEYFRSSVGAGSRKSLAKLKDPKNEPHLRDLCAPVAVRPNRFNPRLLAQSGTFTLHGGKVYGSREQPVRIPDGDGLPAPIHLEKLKDHGSQPFLKTFLVEKDPVREELRHLGIHHATLFPDLDGQAAFLKQRWKYGSAAGDDGTR